MKTNLLITDTEKDLLKRLVASKLETKNDELAHANAHACELHDPDLPALVRIWEKLNET